MATTAEALGRYVADIRRLAAAHGARNPDLLDWRQSILTRYYSPALLASERARRRFVFPDAVA